MVGFWNCCKQVKDFILIYQIFCFFLAKIVSENFFGGFKKDDEESKRMNRKQWIDELILKSKQLKVIQFELEMFDAVLL